jgi:MFS transporter, NNP family, nitrate/nitrite transporter
MFGAEKRGAPRLRAEARKLLNAGASSIRTCYTMRFFSFRGRYRTLHLTWLAFFVSFMVWFNHAPLMAAIRDQLELSEQEIKALLILNVALTIPARILIGMLVDKFGPRYLYSALLAAGGMICFAFALAQDFEALALARFLLGFVGAGFVIGIRLIGEWFPSREVGLAEGVYGGLGNFGASAAAMLLPALALAFGGADGWRYAVAITGVMALIYAGVFVTLARDTPEGATYFKPNKAGALEVSSPADFTLYLIASLPLYGALALIAWKLGPSGLRLLGAPAQWLVYALVTGLYFSQALRFYQVNRMVFERRPPEYDRYPFKQVALMNLAYLATFGAELAVVSMLPLFFTDTFNLSPLHGGLLASLFALMNVVARPVGGLVSDRLGRKRTLVVLLAGFAAGFFTMSHIDAEWPIALAALTAMGCAFFVNAGAGAVFAVVPLIKRRMTGQIAGMTGAYGNVGGVSFLTVLSFVSPQIFFLVIAATGLMVLAMTQLFMDEPRGKIAEVLPDGTVQLIDVG